MTLSSGLRRGLFNRPSVAFAGPYTIEAIGGAAPEAAYGMFPLRVGYNGYCMRVVRASDGASLDIGFDKGFLDVATLDIFLNATTGAVSIWYDQSGNGRDATQPDPAFRMRLYPTNNMGGVRSITADVTQFLLVPPSVQCTGATASLLVLGRSCGLANVSNSVFSYNSKTSVAIASITKSGTTATVTSAGHGLSNGTLVWIQGASDNLYNGRFTVANATTNTFDYTMTGTPAANASTSTALQWSCFSTDLGIHGYNGYSVTGTPAYASSNSRLRVIQSAAVMGLINNGSGAPSTLHMNNETNTTARNVEIATTTQGGFIGPAALFTTANVGGHIEFNAVLIYDRTLSGSEIAGGKAALYGVGHIDPNLPRQVVMVGDSITMGNTIFGARPFGLLFEDRYVTPATTWLLGQNGLRISTIAADTNQLKPTTMYRSGLAKNVLHVFAGTNDIAQNDTASTAYGNLSSYITAAKAAGFMVAVGTMLPRGTLTSPQETERLAYNSLIIANSAGADAVIDYASIPALANPANATMYTDTVHPTAAGHVELAAIAGPVINSLLV